MLGVCLFYGSAVAVTCPRCDGGRVGRRDKPLIKAALLEQLTAGRAGTPETHTHTQNTPGRPQALTDKGACKLLRHYANARPTRSKTLAVH